ncbi:rhodanese-like domain-containing protein [Allosalinactinospora lopnorensis]|uniref:rhodanese-like domain-containing protein n=1 Tax=Allosalinactinospora lopnorensis TaxID=1352348 RepID=UPI000623C4EE|nr:rhodanese-like domain-containing protein [Allosalinactinospora lopnorensis]
MDFTASHLVPLVDEGLGNSAYLVDLGDGGALAVDVSRDLRALRAAVARRGLRVRFVAETHLHADFVSGARQLREEGASVIASAAGGREFPHLRMGEGDELDLGGLTLRFLATPGHTREHLAYLLCDGPRVLGVFTGGSLVVGAAARTDLVDPERTHELARAQYASLRRLAELPDETAVWPTHGAGSFCSAPPGAHRVSTIGAERAANPLLAAPDAEAFADALIADLGSFPPYFLRLAEVNRRGPALVPESPPLAGLSPEQARAAMAEGAQVVDVRPVPAFTAGHIPGALSNALRPQFASWLGWLLDPGAALVMVAEQHSDAAEAARQAAKIGHEGSLSVLEGGMAAWEAAGFATSSLSLVTAAQMGDRPVLDVRQETEYTAGHVPGALHSELGDLPGQAGGLARGPHVVMCGHGERAATAASLLARAGNNDLAVLEGGPGDWAETTGRDLEEGR